MRKRLQLKWMLTASTLLATSFTLTSTGHAEEGDGTSRGIATTEEHGRTIYVDDDVPAREPPAPAFRVRPSAVLYCSGKGNRWKPVPSANTKAGKAARSAAAEVGEFYGRDSVPSANAKTLQADSHWHQATPEQIGQSIVMAAERHNVHPTLVRALINVESNLNSNAVSHKGAMGLMELMPKTTRQLNLKTPFDPEQNADAGLGHRKYLLEKYNGDVNLILAVYDAGARGGSRHPYYRG
jgi:soluble lytic murein transglycosylase-like protein